jgi:hypothetical protein
MSKLLKRLKNRIRRYLKDQQKLIDRRRNHFE